MKLDLQIIRSHRKTVTLSVERDASVVVRAPEDMAEEEIRRLVEAKKLWVYEKVNHDQKYPSHQQRKEFVSGESILYLGRSYQLEVCDHEPPGVHFRSRFSISRRSRREAARLFREWYSARAKERIPPRATYFAEAIGVTFNHVMISDLKVRWGSCTPRGSLNFSWRIMKAPPTVIDYLIVHELTHLIEPNHTPRFWNIVSVQVPRTEWAKQWLREHGDLLEVDF